MSILNFMAKARIVFVRACRSSLSCVGLACTSCLSGFQQEVQEQRGEDERYRTNHQHRVITSCQSSAYKRHCIQSKLPFRFATLIPPAVFSLGAAGGHIYQMIAAGNFSPGNVGLVLPSDIVIPVIGFIFLWLSYKHPKSTTTRHKLT